MSRAATGSLQNRLHPSFEAQTQQNPPYVALGGFEAQITNLSWAPHLVHVLHDQMCVPPVLDHAGNMVHSTTSSHECVSQVSVTTASHPAALVH
jgi:hypothetical protein